MLALKDIIGPVALLAAAGGLLHLDVKNIGFTMVGRSIFIGPILGALTGVLLHNTLYSFRDCLDIGITIGIIFEMLWLYKFPVGAEIHPEGSLATCIAVPLTVLISEFVNRSLELSGANRLSIITAILIVTVPYAYLSEQLYRLYRIINNSIDANISRKLKSRNICFVGQNIYGTLRVFCITFTIAIISIIGLYELAVLAYNAFPTALGGFRFQLLKAFNFADHYLIIMCLIFYLNAINFHNRLVYFIIGIAIGVIELFVLVHPATGSIREWHLGVLIGLSVLVSLAAHQIIEHRKEEHNHAADV